MSTPPPQRVIIVAFLAVLGLGLPLQVIIQLSDGERPTVLQLFDRLPSEDNLRDFERELERRAAVPNQIRPWIQWLNFTLLQDAGEKGIRGQDGWLFYRPGVWYLTQAWSPGTDGAGTAIRSFHDQLAERGIRLLVVPVPGKATVYPDRLTSRAEGLAVPVNTHTQALVRDLRREGIEALDLTDEFARTRRQQQGDLYLAQDTHWSPLGLRIAARAISNRILGLGWLKRGPHDYELEEVTIRRHGDIVEMMQSPPLRDSLPVEEIETSVVQLGRIPYADDPASEVLILGDSFLRIYQTDAPGSAGLIAHLADQLGFPLASIVNDGGASTLVRQQLSRSPQLLEGKRVVIWQFVERDIRFGVEGWQDVQLR